MHQFGYATLSLVTLTDVPLAWVRIPEKACMFVPLCSMQICKGVPQGFLSFEQKARDGDSFRKNRFES
ncbi:hypothetical protein TNCV_3748431 [Trichonephila clavipes]|nr:hypothetical protein TNCV_3748431 [Trichonephila clavipes]